MIPERLSFRNEFCSRVKFVPHWHDKIERLRLRRSCSRGFCARSETQSASGTKFDLSLHDTRMKSCTRTTVSFGLNSGMTCMGNEMSFRYHVNTNKEIYGDEINSFQAVCHSGMWIARLNELRNKGISRARFWAMCKKQSNYSLLRIRSLCRHLTTHKKRLPRCLCQSTDEKLTLSDEVKTYHRQNSEENQQCQAG